MSTGRSLATVLLSAVLLAAAGGDFETGRQAYERGDYAAALAEWLPLAEHGDAEAQYRVGRLYYYGHGVGLDYEVAARWYLAAAEQGHARSQTNLATMLEEGRGVPADPARAAEWYAKAAAQGRAVACNNLARMYEEGRGVSRDDHKAAELYEAAAKQGYAEAQYRLARMYEEGRGVAADPELARKWDRRAARNGYIKAAAAAAAAGAAVDEHAEDETPAFEGPIITVVPGGPPPPPPVPAEAEPAPAAEAVAPAPPGEVGLDAGIAAYERGDFAAAARAWQPPASAGDAEAQYRLGSLYRLGQGVPADHAAALEWYRRAAEQDHGMALYMLGLLSFRGGPRGAGPDYVQAYVWFSRAAAKGVGDAEDWLARLTSKMTSAERSEAARLVAEANR